MRFGLRNAKAKMFHTGKLDDELNPVDAVNKLMEEMKTDDPMQTDQQAGHVEDSTDKSAALEALFS